MSWGNNRHFTDEVMDFALNRCNSSSFRCLTIISFQLFQLYKLAITLDFHCFVYLKMISDFFSVIFCKGTGKGMNLVPRPIAIYLFITVQLSLAKF